MKRRLIPLIISLLLTVTFCPLSEAESSAELSPGPAVRIIPPPAEQPEPEEAAEPPPEVHVIEECTVTWYTEDTCGKAPRHPACFSGVPTANQRSVCGGERRKERSKTESSPRGGDRVGGVSSDDASGLPVEEGVTCAVDPEVIPLFSEVYVQYADGSLARFQATDTGVTGSWVDIYTPDYEYAVQCGLQRLTVYWTGPEE